MFSTLVFIALIFIFAGIYLDRKKIVGGILNKFTNIRDSEEINKKDQVIKELEAKLNQMPSIRETENGNLNLNYEEPLDGISFNFIKEEVGEGNFENTYQETKIKKEEQKLYRKLKQINKYEIDGKGIEEISELVDMKKGEILLLKNLHKKYQI